MPTPTSFNLDNSHLHFGYVCFFKGLRWECYARTSFEAQQLAVKQFKPKKREVHMITVVLADQNWNPAST